MVLAAPQLVVQRPQPLEPRVVPLRQLRVEEDAWRNGVLAVAAERAHVARAARSHVGVNQRRCT